MTLDEALTVLGPDLAATAHQVAEDTRRPFTAAERDLCARVLARPPDQAAPSRAA